MFSPPSENRPICHRQLRQPRFRQWGWDHDDVFDFMRTFDTMVLPAACLTLSSSGGAQRVASVAHKI